MSRTNNTNKKNFIKLIIANAEAVSYDEKTALEYLSEQGIDASPFIKDELNRIKRIKLKLEAEKTRQEMISTSELKEKAKNAVKNLLRDADFSFSKFVQQERLVLQNRNLESLTPEDIESTLISYFYLKYVSEERGIEEKNDKS